MNSVILNFEEYRDLSGRGTNVVGMLKPLCRSPHGPAYSIKQGEGGKKIIATHEGSPVLSDFTCWRFATKSRGYWAGYYEIWSLVPGTNNTFELEKAYLTVYRGESEFVCLHCDPAESGIGKKIEYKQSPHLHVEVAESPVHKAHISICVGNNAAVLADIGNLTRTFERGIEMIKLEIMDRIEQ